MRCNYHRHNSLREVIGRRDNLPFGDALRDVAEPGPGASAAMLAEGAQPTGLWTWSNTIRTQYAQMEKDAATGLDHTPFRKYDSGWGRWTSPDPYGGSMHAGDPQSFNRYAYVSNDPVNRADPSGLMQRICDEDGKCYPWEPPVATAYSGADSLSLFGGYFTPASQSVGRNLFFAPLRPAPVPEPPAPEPQGPARQEPERTTNACADMARIAQEIMDKEGYSGTVGQKLRTFDRRFTTLYAGRPATSLWTAGRQFLNRGAGATVNRYYLGQTGFRAEFREMDRSGNPAAGFHDQTHHFAFYLSMGINEAFSGSGALWMGQRLHRVQDNEGDARLGRAAYDIGRGLLSNPQRLHNLGQIIRSAVCDQ